MRYEASADLSSAFLCNCSICIKKGTLWNFVPEAQFSLLAGEEDLVDCQFQKTWSTTFHAASAGWKPLLAAPCPTAAKLAALNVRCLDGIEIADLTLTPVDGRSP